MNWAQKILNLIKRVKIIIEKKLNKKDQVQNPYPPKESPNKLNPILEEPHNISLYQCWFNITF